MPVEKVCIVCGKSFSVPPCRSESAKACSNECAVEVRARSKERKVVKTCSNCGNEFSLPQSHKNRRVYCSNECRYTSETFLQAKSDRTKGDKNPMWKGGEPDTNDGYVLKLSPHHPFSRNGYILKHRLVMEQWLREENPGSIFLIEVGNQLYLQHFAVVHHHNGNRKDNSRRNLIVCTNSAHQKIHNGKMPEPGSYWPEKAKIKLGKKSAITPNAVQ